MKTFKKLAAALTAVLICSNSAITLKADAATCSHGYQTFGDRIFSTGLSGQYYVIESSIYSGTNSTRNGMAINKAVSDWYNATSAVDLGQTYTNSDTTPIIRFRSSELEGTIIGLTEFYSTFVLPSPQLTISNGVLPSNYAWTTITLDFDSMDGYSYTFDKLTGVSAHEVGHAMGLAHRNTEPSVSIMCQMSYGRTVQIPQSSDAAAINHLY